MDAMKSPIRIGSLKNLKRSSLHVAKPTSLSTLIVWNISKALEESPSLNIKEAVTSAQSRLDQISDAGHIQNILSDNPYERHLACALLAWQQLGHRDADSLCRFIENNTKKEESSSKISSTHERFDSFETLSRTSKMSCKVVSTDIGSISQHSESSRYEEAICFSSFNSFSMGPVIKLPVESKVVMRVDNTSRCGRAGGPAKKPRAPEKDITTKIDQACCMDSACAERLTAMDATTAELRVRSGKLARREAHRVELLERAEAAWKDLEQGYQRRLSLAEEKEEDIAKQIAKTLEERVGYKNACMILAQELKDRSGRAELERVRLSEVEKSVCERACLRMRASEESAKGDAVMAEQSCKAAQLDRDLQFKEEQARRNMMSLQSEVASHRALTNEAERATRSELGALRDQIAEVSNKLLKEDAQNEKTKAALEDLRQEKMEIVEDLDGCKALCDSQMQGKMDELIKKRDQLAKLRERVMECRCKGPVDVGVEVKRTPSLAALCKCSPEDKILECCSCTSIRTQLLSNLFADLFSGLQSELSGAVTLMPCQLLKCLEDKHNWDRASVIKSNLKNYFTKLLVGELDIAIATSIENYHAKWVGISCADVVKMGTPGPEDNTEKEGWQERAIERRAQKLASQLASQLFQERADELTQRAQDLVNAGPPPCECEQKAKLPEGCSCGKKSSATSSPRPETETQVFWHQALQDVTQLRIQVEDLKKDSLRKEDLMTMEDRFEKFIQLSSVGGPPERDLHDTVERRPAKKAHGKAAHGGEAKKNEGSVKTVAAKNSIACSCLVNHTSAAVLPPAPVTPTSWQQAMQDVTLLRFQLEDLKKESIKKEDLKMMEDKIAKIMQRASENTAFTNSKMKYSAVGNLVNEANKYSKINRAVTVSDTDKPTTSTKKSFGPIAKEIKVKPFLYRGNNKPYKKSSPTYAVNVCLCSTKRQEQKELNDRNKLETNTWKQKISRDNVSQMSSNVRQSKPINNSSFLSQDISTRTYSKEYDDKSCTSNCVCFHKIPSNTSIDKLLETLAKWKGDIDASFTENEPRDISCCNYSKINHRCLLDDNITFESNTSLKSREKFQEISVLKRQEKDASSSQDACDHKISDPTVILEQSNAKILSKFSAKLTGPTVTDSVYMGAVNLDKSQEELCKCNKAKKNNKSPFKCIASSKCTCEKVLKAKNIENQIIHIKKEKHKEISVIETKQERRVNDIVVLPNTPTSKELNKDQTPEKEIDKNKADKKTDAQAIRTSDYQIQFLGVTLVDVNPKTKRQILPSSDNINYNNKNGMTNNAVPCDKYHLGNRKISKHEHKQNYSEKVSSPVPELPNYLSNKDIRNRNILINNDDEIEYPHFFINNDSKQEDMCETYYEKENIHKHEMMLNYMERTNISQLHKNIKYKNSDLGYKTASDQNISNMGYNNKQCQKLYEEVNANAKNSHESEISKKSYKTASESHPLYDKSNKQNGQEDLPKEIMKENLPISSNQNSKTAQMFSCECSIKLNEFRDFINANFLKNTNNEDIALDVQSMKYFKEHDESCVCCRKFNNENCKDLEDNAFHLLEEYLKKKLNAFRASTCTSFCIPAKEEEKIFSIIVQRVKRIISDSTNQITCKCSTEEKKSQGSWNRVYGLLQEYLKIKIKKVQCSCLLAEDNKDKILPDVLEKISNLIEYDFQRLKNICSCINDTNTQENKNNNGKQVDFEVLENDQHVMARKYSSIFSPLDDQISHSAYQAHQPNYLTQSMNSQLPLTSAIEDESCNSQKTNDNLFNADASIFSLHKSKNCDSSLTNTVVELSDKNINDKVKQVSSSNTDYTTTLCKTNTRMTTKHIENNCLVKSAKKRNKSEKRLNSENIKIDSLVNKTTDKTDDIEKRKQNELTSNINGSKSHPSNFVKNLHSIHFEVEQRTLSNSCNKICHHKNTVSIKNNCTQNNEVKSKKQEMYIPNSCEVPYVGYTVTCSCDKSLGPCTCPKNISNTDPDMINDIWKKSVPNEKFYEKISYILPKQPMESVNQNVNSLELSEDADSVSVFKKNCANDNLTKSEATCCVKLEPMVLKTSTYDVVKANAETNTFKDNSSIDTDCSNNEDIDWCECNSQFNPSKHLDNDRLKRSIFFPAPLDNFGEQPKDDVSYENNSDISRKHVCDCERVPICYVKMLVENIETKLANSNCTCDSLIPKVCPIHSKMC